MFLFVPGKFGENILFLTVSKTSSLKTIVQSLFLQHYRFVIPHLKISSEEIMNSPMILVMFGLTQNPSSRHSRFTGCQIIKFWWLLDLMLKDLKLHATWSLFVLKTRLGSFSYIFILNKTLIFSMLECTYKIFNIYSSTFILLKE